MKRGETMRLVRRQQAVRNGTSTHCPVPQPAHEARHAHVLTTLLPARCAHLSKACQLLPLDGAPRAHGAVVAGGRDAIAAQRNRVLQVADGLVER